MSLNEILCSEPLSKALQQTLRLALERQATELATWIQLELGGYYDSNGAMNESITVPKYRTVVGSHFTPSGQRLQVQSDLSFVNEMRLREGVAALESLRDTRHTVVLQDPTTIALLAHHLKVQVSTFQFDSSALAQVLSQIRTELVARAQVLATGPPKSIPEVEADLFPTETTRTFQFSLKEWLTIAFATFLALASLKADDPLVVVPMLALSDAVLVLMCMFHKGSRKNRTLIALVFTGILVFIGWRDLRGKGAAIKQAVVEQNGAKPGGHIDGIAQTEGVSSRPQRPVNDRSGSTTATGASVNSPQKQPVPLVPSNALVRQGGNGNCQANAIGGNATVENSCNTFAPLDRRLNKNQADTIASYAAKFCTSHPKVVVTAALGNQEAQRYATDFIAVLNRPQVGCHADLSLPIPGLKPDVVGVNFAIRGRPGLNGDEAPLFAGLGAAGIPVRIHPLADDFFPNETFVLVIGAKE